MTAAKRPRGRPPAPCETFSPTSKRCFDRVTHPYPPYKCACIGTAAVSRPKGRPPAPCDSFPSSSRRCKLREVHPYPPYRCTCSQPKTFRSQFMGIINDRVRSVQDHVGRRPDGKQFWKRFPSLASRLQWLSSNRTSGLSDDQLINMLNQDSQQFDQLMESINRKPLRANVERKRIHTNLNGVYWRN